MRAAEGASGRDRRRDDSGGRECGQRREREGERGGKGTEGRSRQRSSRDRGEMTVGAERWVAMGQRAWERGRERGSGSGGGGGGNGAEERVGADSSGRQRARGQRRQGQAGGGSAGQTDDLYTDSKQSACRQRADSKQICGQMVAQARGTMVHGRGTRRPGVGKGRRDERDGQG